MKAFLTFTSLAFLISIAPAAQAQNCSNSQFKGVYGAIAKGEFIAGLPDPLNGPTTRIGRVTPDGNGNSHIEAVTSLNGIVLQEQYDGTYTVHPDCTVDVVLNIPFPGVGIIPFAFTGVLSDNFQQMDMALVNPPGSTVGLTLRQQNRANCSVHDLNGGYTMDLRGTFGNPGPYVPFHGLGRIVFDGKGAFSGQATLSTNGSIQSPAPLAGTYAVTPSCKLTMTLAGEGGFVFSGMLIDNSTGADLIVSGPTFQVDGFDVVGAVVSGTLKKQ